MSAESHFDGEQRPFLADYPGMYRAAIQRAKRAEARVTELEAALGSVLGQFYETGSLGGIDTHKRTGWISKATLAEWRAALSTPAPQGEQ